MQVMVDFTKIDSVILDPSRALALSTHVRHHNTPMFFIFTRKASNTCAPKMKIYDLVAKGSMNDVAATEIFWQTKGLLSQY